MHQECFLNPAVAGIWKSLSQGGQSASPWLVRDTSLQVLPPPPPHTFGPQISIDNSRIF